MALSGREIRYYKNTSGLVGITEEDYLALSSSDQSKYLLKLIYSWEAIQDVVNNTSTINFKLMGEALVSTSYSTTEYIKLTPDWIDYYVYDKNTAQSGDYFETITSEFLPDCKLYVGEGEKLLGQFTDTLKHKANGTNSIKFKVKVPWMGGYKLVNGVETATYTTPTGASFGYVETTTAEVALDPIPRHAVLLSAPERFTDEDSPTITFAIPDGATNVRAYIAFNTSTIDIGSYPVSGSSYTFRFTDEEKRKLWSILEQGLDTKAMYFYVMSEYQGELYHSGPIISTLEVINYKPTLDPEVYDTVPDIIDRLTGNKYILVRYASKPYFSTGAQAHKGATIDVESVKNGETTKYGATGTFDSVTDNLFKFAVTDNFGRSTSAEMEFSKPNYFVDYVKLTASVSVTEMTADGDVAVTIKGKYFNGSFGKRNNNMRMSYDIAKNGGDFDHIDKGYIYPTMNGSDYTYMFTISGLDYMSVYDLTVRVSDEVSVEGTEANVIVASTPIFDWGRQDFNFNVPVNIEGDLTVAGNITAGGNTVPTLVAQGTAGIWTYRTWSDGTAECWGKKDVSVTFPSSANWGGLYTTGAISGSNISFPFGLFAETPVVNASLLIRSVGGILMAPGGNDSNKATWDQTGVYEIARGAAVSGTQYYTINYDVKGKWK
jgi:hypothetical protein